MDNNLGKKEAEKKVMTVWRNFQRWNPRNKVALQPGHSLMDWIRLGASGRVDLTGVGGRPRDVSPEQLAQHASRADCWLALRGRVYNVTHYMDFHPGGAEELLRGAGRDATDLFNQVHAWVNYESILQKCVVGRLRRDSQGASDELRAALANSRASLGRMLPPLAPPAPDKAAAAAAADKEEEEERKQKEAVPAAATQAVAEVGAPRMDWFQQVSSRFFSACPS
ncbi:Cytochrome b5, partial [Gryllus bimaculatus]